MLLRRRGSYTPFSHPLLSASETRSLRSSEDRAGSAQSLLVVSVRVLQAATCGVQSRATVDGGDEGGGGRRFAERRNAGRERDRAGRTAGPTILASCLAACAARLVDPPRDSNGAAQESPGMHRFRN